MWNAISLVQDLNSVSISSNDNDYTTGTSLHQPYIYDQYYAVCPSIRCNLIRDVQVQNRKVSAANRQRVLIGWSWLKRKSSYEWTRVSWLPHATRNKKSVGLQTRRCEDSRNLQAPFLEWAPKKESHTQTLTCEDRPREEACVRTTIENVKENSRSVSALFLLTRFCFTLSC